MKQTRALFMKTGKMITRWSGYLPVVEEIPSKHAIWVRLESLIDKVKRISPTIKTQEKGIET